MTDYYKDVAATVNEIENNVTKFIDNASADVEKIKLKQREFADELMQIKQRSSSSTGMLAAADAGIIKRGFGVAVWEELQKNADLLSKTSKLRMEIKAATDPITTTSAGHRKQGGVGVLAESLLGIQGAFETRQANGISSLTYSRYTGQEGAAAVQAGEGAAKAAIRPTFSEINQSAITIAGYTKLSRQALSDSSELQRAVDVSLTRSVSTALDDLLNVGSVTPAFAGMLSLSTAYTSLVYESLVDAASEAVASMQEDGFQPAVVAFRPSDWLSVQTAQNAITGDYLSGGYLEALPTAMRGLRVVLSPTVPSGKVLVIDPSHLELLIVDNMAVEVGYENDDFTRNIVTLLGEMRVIPTFRAVGAARLITPKAPA